MFKRSPLVFALALAVVLAGAGVASGKAWSSAGSKVNAQLVEHRTADASTKSTKWRDLPTTGRETSTKPCERELCGTPGVSPITVISRHAMSITVSVDVRGGPVELRVVGTRDFRPFKARFNPRPGDTSRSFTFVSQGTRTAQCNDINLQWRSPTDAEIVSKQGAITLTYQRPHDPGFGCA